MQQVRAGVLIIGVGNRSRGDDAAGLIAAARAREHLAGAPGISVVELDGDAKSAIDLIDQHATVILADAVRFGGEPGRIYRIDASGRPLPARLRRTSSHGFGIAHTIELARVLGRLPPRVVVYGIEAACFDLGTSPSPMVTSAALTVADRIAREARRAHASAQQRPTRRRHG